MASPDLFCAHCGAANAAMATTCFACGSPLSQDDPLLIQTGTTTHTVTVSSSPTITGQLAHEYLLKGRYRVLKQIGTGGFGAVYQAQDLRRNNAPVAIKSINLHRLSPEQIIEATDIFNREVGMLSELEHPNLPHIYEHFTDPEHWYLVMDFIEGETLEHYLSQAPGGRLPLSEVLDMGMQLCTVLDYLHSQQPPIIFRDVKPGNIMRTSSGHLYLIDFGIARHFTPGQARDTMPLGSPGYAPPEQYGKAQTTVQSDIYSLGATLQTLLTGKDPLEPPFGYASPYAEDREGSEDYRPTLDSDIIREPPFGYAPPYTEEQEVPAELPLLLAQMLDIDVDKRPASIAIVKQRLLQIKKDQQQQAAHYSAYARSSPPPNTPTISPTSASSASRPAAKQKVFAPSSWPPPSSARPRVSGRRVIGTIVFIILLFVCALNIHIATRAPLPDCSPESGAREITAGPDGALWFTESCGDKIGRITTQGTITEFTIPQGSAGFTAGPDGAIWFMEGGIDEKIGRITTQGSITEFALPTSECCPLGITTGPDGALWFIEYGKIGRITTQGTITEFTAPT
jgi:serine/threonine protein kinase